MLAKYDEGIRRSEQLLHSEILEPLSVSRNDLLFNNDKPRLFKDRARSKTDFGKKSFDIFG